MATGPEMLIKSFMKMFGLEQHIEDAKRYLIDEKALERISKFADDAEHIRSQIDAIARHLGISNSELNRAIGAGSDARLSGASGIASGLLGNGKAEP